MNLFNLRSLISFGLLISIVSFPLLSPHQPSAALALPDNLLTTTNRSIVGGAEAMRFKRQPLRFEINQGQSDPQVRFLARAGDSTLFLTANEAVLRLPKLSEDVIAGKTASRKTEFVAFTERAPSAVIKLRPAHSNPQPRLVGLGKLPGKSNYFIGNDPRKWRTNVEAYAKVRYENVYPGIDLIYYGNEAGEIEYDFVVSPGADPDLIAMSVEGADKVEIDAESGGLILNTIVGRVRQHAPRIYQEVNGARHEIAGRYLLREGEKQVSEFRTPNPEPRTPEVAFELGEYDESKPLVIDPVVVYSTLLGGAAGNFDGAWDVTVDAQGNAYIVGTTQSSDFPTRNPFDRTKPDNSTNKAFISKFAPDGSLIFSTFFGGNDSGSRANAIAVDATGALYVTGATAATDFPLKNAFQSTKGGSLDAFVAKLTGDGTAIIYSSFLGGNQIEDAKDLKLDSQNNVYIVGTIDGRGAASVTFPTVNPTQANYGGGDRDIFFSIVSANGSSLLASTYLGGNGDEEVESVTVSSDESRVGIVGATASTNLITAGIAPQAVDPSCKELESMLIVLGPSFPEQLVINKLRFPFLTCAEIVRALLPKQGQITKSGMIIGSGATPASGSALVSQSSPRLHAAGGGFDVGIATFDENNVFTGRASFGGSRDEFVSRAVVDARGAVYVTGDTNSTNLPTINPTQSEFGGGSDDGFVVVFAPDSFEPVFATYLGGDGSDLPTGIAVDPQGNIFVSGIVISATTFPTTPGAFQRDIKGPYDAFLVKLSPVFAGPSGDFSLSFDSPTVTGEVGTKARVTVNINRTDGFTGNVTVNPPPPSGGIKPKPNASITTTDSSITFKMKIGGGVTPGSYPLTFTGTDDAGRTRTATVTLIVQ